MIRKNRGQAEFGTPSPEPPPSRFPLRRASRAPSPVYLLGITCNIHESSAAIVRNGVLIAAAEEERFTRRKHDNRFPAQAIAYCLREAGISMRDVSHAGFYWQPWKGLLKRLWWLVRYFPASLQTFRGGKRWRGSVATSDPASRGPGQAVADGIARQVPLHRPSPVACRQRLLRVAVRVSGHSHRRSVWRGLHDAARPRQRQSDDSAAAFLPAGFAGHLLCGADAVPRVSRQRRRIQGHGAGRAMASHGWPRRSRKWSGSRTAG